MGFSPRAYFKEFFQSWDRKELVILTRQLAALLGSGTPISRCLNTVHDQARDPLLRRAWGDILNKVVGGHSLSLVASRWPQVFSPFYLAMLRTGETTGKLDAALERLAMALERDMAVAQKVRGALSYPAFILGLTGALTVLLFCTVVPGFVEIFRSSGIALPFPTRVLVLITDLMVSPTTWLVSGALAIEIWWFARRLSKRPDWSLRSSRWLLGLPLVGGLLLKTANCRFCQSMQTLLGCGMTLDRSLTVAGEATSNTAYEMVVREGVDLIKQGKTLSRHMRDHPETYPSLLTQLVSVGEETASLEAMFERVGRELETEIDQQITTLAQALEPLLLMVVASVVGFIILAVFLPLYGSLNSLTGSS